MPFPDIIFPEMVQGTSAPYFDDHTVLSMSLSKIGLPALRTGIVIASVPIIRALGALNSITALASGSLGQILAEGLVRTGELKILAETYVTPFYREKSLFAQNCIHEFMHDREYRIHRSEGALFLWLFLPDLSVSTKELYARLKEKGVIIVPGEYFFFGREEGSDEETAWKRHPHREKCLRLNYSRPETEVREGLRILSEVVSRYQKG
jgi:valine--pyruvate aminotransferase